jgi:Amt family ammonium transporter
LNGVAGGVRGLFYGDPKQFIAQVVGTVSCVAFIFSITWVFFKVCDAVMGIRVSPAVELEGLDVPEMGGHGYPEIQGPPTMVHAPASGAPRVLGAMTPEHGR